MIKLNKQKILDFIFGFFMPSMFLITLLMYGLIIAVYIGGLASIIYGLINYTLITIVILFFLVSIYQGFKEIKHSKDRINEVYRSSLQYNDYEKGNRL